MSAKEHTPAPWTVREISHSNVPGQRAFAIDFNDDQEQVVDWVYEEADAKLIAAAPDLLSIAKRWAALDAQWHPDRYESEKAELLRDTRAIIAQATE
ncbi:hypothetical protein C3E97_027725 [Pseudomonas sp. MWU12-2115]|uniref:hypothetical protein n=1 Tax=unclassified Pseudomonas TaxID=196821 RepID=UPI000CD4CC2D|nr:hypothetical protein [Pseudomonas sp. MWU12-2020]RBB97509.1 hypothetical protein C3E97_027725 [Pseudomonas sp. MWU12-2115]